jgi:hypothetical protein
MVDSGPPHPWMPLQIVAGLRKGAAKRRNRDSSMHSCMDIALRPSPTRFSRPQGHAGPKSTI